MITIPSKIVANHVTDRKADWQPKVIAFLCTLGSYIGADQAGINRLQYDSHLEIIRVPCSGRVDPLFILKAFEKGADGVLVASCQPGNCHYLTGNYQAQKKFILFKNLLEFCGIDPKRIHFSWLSAHDGATWPKLVNQVVSQVREAGPFFNTCGQKEDRS